MLFFTREWWEAGCPDAEAVFSRYSAHFETVRAAMPQDIVALEEEHTLHDSEVKEIVCDFAARAVTMRLEGWNRKLDTKVRYVLEFVQTQTFEQIFPQQEYVEAELGDLGYWECDAAQGNVRMNMLFVSGAEFHLVFKNFRLQALPSEA